MSRGGDLTPGALLFPTPCVVGHRGAGSGIGAGGFVENTVGSFRHAVELGAGWVELDVRVNATGTLVVSHDAFAGGRPVGELDDAASVRLGLATFAEVDAALPPAIGIDVELKVDRDAGGAREGARALERLVPWLAAHRDERPWLATSFDLAAAGALARSGVATGWLTDAGIPLERSLAGVRRTGLAVAAVHVSAVGASAVRDREARALGSRDTGSLDPGSRGRGRRDQGEAARPERCRDRRGSERPAALGGIELLVWDVSPADVGPALCAGAAALCADDVAGVRAALDAQVH